MIETALAARSSRGAFASDPNDHLIQMPSRARRSMALSEAPGKCRAELQHPPPNGFTLISEAVHSCDNAGGTNSYTVVVDGQTCSETTSLRRIAAHRGAMAPELERPDRRPAPADWADFMARQCRIENMQRAVGAFDVRAKLGRAFLCGD